METREARSRERFAMEMSLKTIQTLLNGNEVSNQTMGLRLLETLFEQTVRQGLSYDYDSELIQFCKANLKSPLGSDSSEIRAATILLLEKFPSAAGAHFGFQPISGYWHPINDSTGRTGEVRRELFIEDLVFGRQDGLLSTFLEDVEDAVGVEFDHDHNVDLEKTKIEIDLFDANTFELLDAALIDQNLGYAIDGNKIRVRQLGSDDLIVTQLFNVRGLLNHEVDIARIIAVVKGGMKSSILENIVEVDPYRFMVSGTEQQLRKVSMVLGLLAAPTRIPTGDLRSKDEAKKKIKRNETPAVNKAAKTSTRSLSASPNAAMTACNQILTAIQNNDSSTLQKWCNPNVAPSTDEDRKEFAMAVTEMKETLRTKRTSVLELREGRSPGEFIGLIEVRQGEAFVIVVERNPLAKTQKEKSNKSHFFRGLKSPNEEDYKNLKLIAPKSNDQ